MTVFFLHIHLLNTKPKKYFNKHGLSHLLKILKGSGGLNGESNDNKDELIEHYDSILRGSSLLTIVAVILFGFLLNISVNPSASLG